MKNDTLLYLALAAGAYFLFTRQSTGANFITCRYPDGTTIQVPSGNAGPFDITHGGQSVMCYNPSSFIGPIPPGGVYC